MAQATKSGGESNIPPSARSFAVPRQSIDLYSTSTKAEGLLTRLMKSDSNAAYSRQGVSVGRKAHPLDMEAVQDFQTSNEHHSTCIHTKVAATAGLGHVTGSKKKEREAKRAMEMGMPPENATSLPTSQDVTAKVDDLLNPLCEATWQELLWDVAENFWEVGNGYIEVVRRGDKITGLHHLPAPWVYVVVEDDKFNKHYEIVCPGYEGGSATRKFACFGDKEDFIERMKDGGVSFSGEQPKDPDEVSEVIHFRRPTSKSKWYGFPDWVSATASIELVQMMMQHNFDFFLNRGVPEFMAIFKGQQIPDPDWKEIEAALKNHIGLGNSHKTLILNLVGNLENIDVQIEKLALDNQGAEDGFSSMRENLALSIVSAHRVPPLLAGIQIPGKLGATNELPNALMAFQILVIGPVQRYFQQTLGQTLGGDMGVDGLTVEDFEFVKITEEIDVGKMDTVARMRQSPMQASSEGRDLNTGVKK